MNSKLLTTEDVAQFLGISPRTMETWRRKGVGPAWLSIGRTVRYRESDVTAWVDSQKQTTEDNGDGDESNQ